MATASIDITMPQLGETVTEGTITRWFKAVGDAVAEDEPLFEVSTDKVDTEVPAAAGGFLGEILVAEGETVDVGAKLAVITATAPGGAAAPEAMTAPEAPDAPAASATEVGNGDRAAAGAAGKAGVGSGGGAGATGAAGEEGSGGPAPAPSRQTEAPGGGRSDAEALPTGPDDGDTGAAGESSSDGSTSRLLSPLVRRLLGEHGIDAGEIPGTGVDGRITRADVMAHVAGRPRADVARSAPAATAPTAAERTTTKAPAPVRARRGDQVVPFSNIRRRTAEHMVRSQATAAHVLVATEVDFEKVDAVRRVEREAFKAEEGFSLTYLPFVVRAAIDALADFPHVNASVGEDELIVHSSVHLGIAVDLSFEGLIVPVIHDADTKRLRPVAREIADLAARARSRKLNADEIAGSTFTITNPGSYGTFITAPVINQPQVAILSTDGVRKKPVVVTIDGSDAIAIHPVGMLALSFDHRAFDGAYASAFLARCREIIETRDWAQEL